MERDERVVQAMAEAIDEANGLSADTLAEAAYDAALVAGIHDRCVVDWDNAQFEIERLRTLLGEHDGQT